MTKDTSSEDKPQQDALNGRRIKIVSSFHFLCFCGCGQVSEFLEKDYIRLRKNQRWSAKGCESDKEIVKEFRGGNIILESDF